MLLAEDGAVKLADFGTTTTIATPATSARNRMSNPSPREQGTPHWMAPEVITGKAKGRAWQAADIWSVGCTVIEMCTGVWCVVHASVCCPRC